MNNRAWSVRRAQIAAGLVAIVVALAWGSQAAAQATDSLRVGTRVRLLSPATDTFLVGELYGLSSDSLLVRLRGGLLASVPRASLSRLQVSMRQRSHPALGALVGFTLGAALAGYLAFATEPGELGTGTVFAIGLAVFGLPGAGVGALVGSAARTDVWRDVPLSTSR